MDRKELGGMLEKFLESEKASTTISRKVDEKLVHDSTTESSMSEIISKEVDAQMRKNNIFIYHLREQENEEMETESMDKVKVLETLRKINSKIQDKDIIKCERLGPSKPDQIRPVRIKLSSFLHKLEIMRNLKNFTERRRIGNKHCK